MNGQRPQIQFVDADKKPGIDEMLDRLHPWMIKPEQNFFCTLLEGHDAEATIRRWMMSTDSELALQCTTLMVADDRICGGLTGFAGRQLRRRRETDLVDLVRTADRPRGPGLRRRLKDLMPLFAPVAPHDYYLSKCGISPGFQNGDLGDRLLDECIRRADSIGYDRIRTDIDADNDYLSGLLDRHGFEVFDRGSATEAGFAYLNMVRET